MIHAPKNNLAWRIRATFAGKLLPKTYLTPDVRRSNPGWGDEIFSRKIERLEFFLPTGHRIVMSGMEKYNFFLEATAPLTGRGNAQIKNVYLCGKLPGQDIVEMWRIENGKVFRDHRPWGREWGGTATRGWKNGLCGKPLSKIAKV